MLIKAVFSYRFGKCKDSYPTTHRIDEQFFFFSIGGVGILPQKVNLEKVYWQPRKIAAKNVKGNTWNQLHASPAISKVCFLSEFSVGIYTRKWKNDVRDSRWCLGKKKNGKRHDNGGWMFSVEKVVLLIKLERAGQRTILNTALVGWGGTREKKREYRDT
ncbi:hypothetical protein KDRO_E06950 [Kluyveromyces lactis]|nr:hypothetical protein KDRO_E06950 [Kluyveromyces lactis]